MLQSSKIESRRIFQIDSDQERSLYAAAAFSHQMYVQASLITFFHDLEVLVKMFFLLVTDVIKVFREIPRWLNKKLTLMLMLQLCNSKVERITLTTSMQFSAFLLPRKLFTTSKEAGQALFSMLVTDVVKSSSLIIFRI